MLKKAMKYIVAVLFSITGLILMELLLPQVPVIFGYDIYKNGFAGVAVATIVSGVVGIFVFGGIGWALTPFFMRHILRYTELAAELMAKVPTSEIMVMIFGVILGLVIANLLGFPFSRLPIIGPFIPLILSVVFAIIGAKVAMRKSKDLTGFVNRWTASFRLGGHNSGNQLTSETAVCKNKLLDTSVIIDGRIVDILKTGFLEGRLIVPHFVLDELQRLSDSADSMKRAKGRRGLDLIHEMQQENKQLIVEDMDFEDIPEVDAKLVKLAKQVGALIVTNDFNLNKVAEIQGVGVLNINDLANAVKPVVIPGEEMKVTLIKEGKEAGQAVAYLEDGTMIVVENGRRYVGEAVVVSVTSVLQTSAGRMIFGKLK